MDNKFTSERFKKHLHYDWYKYVGVLLLGIFFFSLIYTWSGNYRDHEVLEGMITCYSWYDTDFESDALGYLNENVDNNTVKKLAIQEVSVQSADWLDIIQGFGLGQRTAFMVLPEQYLKEFVGNFMCLYNTSEDAGAYNYDVWEKIIPEQLRDFYAIPENAEQYADMIAAAEKSEDAASLLDELNALNDNVYFARGATGGFGVFALRIDNLPNIAGAMSFKEPGVPDEKYYLLLYGKNSNVGKYGVNEKTYSHNEAFYLFRFILTRYGVAAEQGGSL